MSLSLDKAQKKKKAPQRRALKRTPKGSGPSPVEMAAEDIRPRHRPWKPSLVENPPVPVSSLRSEETAPWTGHLLHLCEKALELRSAWQERKIRIPLPDFLTIREDDF